MGKIIDLTGQKFGMLTGICKVEDQNTNGKRKRNIWLFKCDCGKERAIRIDAVLNGRTISCGCSKTANHSDMIGKKYNHLIPIKYIDGQHLLFRCDCGQEKVINARMVEKGQVKSCGNCKTYNKIGKTFGNLKVIALSEKTNKKKHRFFDCVCKCGNKITINANRLSNKSSCGCTYKKQTPNVCNLVGEKFGSLKVVRKNKERSLYGNVLWECKCICGNTRTVDTYRLRSGVVTECLECSRKKRTKKIMNVRINKVKQHIGEKHNRLTIKDVVRCSKYNEKETIYCICECECGNIIKCKYRELVKENYKSCGCFKEDFIFHNKHNNYPFNWYFIKDNKKIDCRSGYEVLYANYLMEQGIDFEYEPTKFHIKKMVFYIPDFYIPKDNLYVEIKGLLTKKNIEKYEIFKETHNFKVIRWKELSKICNVSSNYGTLLNRARKMGVKIEDYFGNKIYKEK